MRRPLLLKKWVQKGAGHKTKCYYEPTALSITVLLLQGMVASKIPTVIANVLIWKVMQSVKDHIHEKKAKDKWTVLRISVLVDLSHI